MNQHITVAGENSCHHNNNQRKVKQQCYAKPAIASLTNSVMLFMFFSVSVG